jgi:hypothetical protein
MICVFLMFSALTAYGFYTVGLLAGAGWWILGLTTQERSEEFTGRLGERVEELWGKPLVQEAPSWSVEVPGTKEVRWLMPEKNEIQMKLATDYRKKGLIWYPTYTCGFDGRYTITNKEEAAQKVRLRFAFPAKDGTYSGFTAALDNAPLNAPVNTKEGIQEIVELTPGQSRVFHVTYDTRGIRDWHYTMDRNVGRVKNLNLTVDTGFEKVDYPEGSLSPMSATPQGTGMRLNWNTPDLITSQDIAVVIPEKLNPGPLTSRITYFAPVCLLFFFVLIATVNVLYKVDIHPMHYLFVAAGFFAFHLLLAYMVGIIHIHAAFAISTVTSVFLVTTYMSGALRGRFPWKVAVAGQMFFLVLFSYSFFLKGITGLTVAVGSVVTLAVLMKVTAHVDWNEVFARPDRPRHATPPPLPVAQD